LKPAPTASCGCLIINERIDNPEGSNNRIGPTADGLGIVAKIVMGHARVRGRVAS
jgi:hypothetical protein